MTLAYEEVLVRDLGITKERVRQIESRVEDKLRRKPGKPASGRNFGHRLAVGSVEKHGILRSGITPKCRSGRGIWGNLSNLRGSATYSLADRNASASGGVADAHHVDVAFAGRTPIGGSAALVLLTGKPFGSMSPQTRLGLRPGSRRIGGRVLSENPLIHLDVKSVVNGMAEG